MPEVLIGGQTFNVDNARADSIREDIKRCAREEISCSLTFVDSSGVRSWTIWTPGTPIVIRDITS